MHDDPGLELCREATRAPGVRNVARTAGLVEKLLAIDHKVDVNSKAEKEVPNVIGYRSMSALSLALERDLYFR